MEGREGKGGETEKGRGGRKKRKKKKERTNDGKEEEERREQEEEEDRKREGEKVTKGIYLTYLYSKVFFFCI